LVMTLVVNTALRKLSSGLALPPGQLIAIWALVLVSSGLPSSGLMRYFVPNLPSYHYYASPENKWDELFGDKIPPALIVQDPMAVKGFFEGLPPGRSIPWAAWARPVMAWGIYAFALYAMMIGLSVMLRRRWVEQERFTFPLVQVPIEIARSPAPGHLLNQLLRNKWVWLGAAIPLAIHTMQGLHKLYPAAPDIPMSVDIGFKEPPLSWAGGLGIYVYPLMVGVAYLLSSEVCFSLWFFYLFLRLRRMVLGWLGLPLPGTGVGWSLGKWAALEEAGGTIALAAWFIWAARKHFRDVFRKAFYGDKSVEDSDEPLSYRSTVLLFLGGVTVMFLWLTHFGGSAAMALLVVTGALAVYVTLAWIVNQGGLIFVESTFYTTYLVASLTGSRLWDSQALLVNMWNENIFRINLREYLLPTLLNIHKITDQVDLNRRSVLKSCVASLAIAFPIALVAALWLPYVHGPAVSFPTPGTYTHGTQFQFKWVASLLRSPIMFSPRYVGHFLLGSLFMVAVMWLRTHFSWFPLHPIGFIISSGWPGTAMWFNLFLGWLIKGGITRWGGYKVYQTARPFFFGLIIGDCAAGAIWITVGFLTGVGLNILPD